MVSYCSLMVFTLRTSDTWYVTCDMWYMTCDTWQVGEVNLLSKFQLLRSYSFGEKFVEDIFHTGWLTDLMNSWHRVCKINSQNSCWKCYEVTKIFYEWVSSWACTSASCTLTPMKYIFMSNCSHCHGAIMPDNPRRQIYSVFRLNIIVILLAVWNLQKPHLHLNWTSRNSTGQIL